MLYIQLGVLCAWFVLSEINFSDRLPRIPVLVLDECVRIRHSVMHKIGLLASDHVYQNSYLVKVELNDETM